MSPVRDGVIQWGAATMAWDGEWFELTVPAAVHAWPANWLIRNLGSRVMKGVGTTIDAQVTPGRLTADGRGWEDFGEIRLHPLGPLPDVELLIKTVAAAFVEAYEQAGAAEAETNTWLARLRVTDPSSSRRSGT
jgi:hypothetical protein